MPDFEDRMVSSIAPPGQAPATPAPRAGRPPFSISITARDGAELVRMTEDEQGRLVVTGDESRWDEGAKRFLHGMMQWSGQVGIRWREEATAAVENR